MHMKIWFSKRCYHLIIKFYNKSKYVKFFLKYINKHTLEILIYIFYIKELN